MLPGDGHELTRLSVGASTTGQGDSSKVDGVEPRVVIVGMAELLALELSPFEHGLPPLTEVIDLSSELEGVELRVNGGVGLVVEVGHGEDEGERDSVEGTELSEIVLEVRDLFSPWVLR